MRTDRRRDMTKLILAFRSFTNSPKNERCHSHCHYHLFHRQRGGRNTTQQLFTSRNVQSPNSKLNIILYPEKKHRLRKVLQKKCARRGTTHIHKSYDCISLLRVRNWFIRSLKSVACTLTGL